MKSPGWAEAWPAAGRGRGSEVTVVGTGGRDLTASALGEMASREQVRDVIWDFSRSLWLLRGEQVIGGQRGQASSQATAVTR